MRAGALTLRGEGKQEANKMISDKTEKGRYLLLLCGY